ncbi:unnamed protein product [Coregonus sp. 'balchen']|nr:unnamed protein product [Coregonus sp. 'balchen']
MAQKALKRKYQDDTASTSESAATTHGMDWHTKQKADKCLAQAINATGSPLMLTTNVHWRSFLNILNLREQIGASLTTSLLDEAEEDAVLEMIDKRQDFCTKPIHAAFCWIQNVPECLNLSAEQIMSAYDMTSAMAHHL